MKLIVNVFKALAVLYWVLAAGLFTSMLFFPSAIDTLYNGYTQFVEVVEEDEPTCLALIPECGYYGEVETEEEPVVEESSEPVEGEVEETTSEETVTSDEETTEPSETEEEVAATEGDSEETVTDEEETEEEATTESEESSEPAEESSEPAEESSEPAEEETEEEEVVTTEEETSEVEEEVVVEEEEEVILLPLITNREEFVTALETLLVYSAIIMLPFTLLAFSIGKKLGSYSAEPVVTQTSEEKAKAKLTDKKAKVDKKLASIKSIGVTGIKIKK
jgi:outer membrane biosynthesis protein TonB